MSNEQLAEVEREFDMLIGDIESDDPKAQKRRRILDVAGELLARQGYRKTSMDELAREAGVAKGTLYLYFANKVDVAMAVLAREKRNYFDRFRDVFDESIPARERLRKWLIALLVGAVEMPLIGRLLEGDREMATILADMPPAMMDDMMRRRYEWLGALIAEVAGSHTWADVEVRDRVDALSALAFFSPKLALPHVTNGMSPQRCAAILADTIIEGICRREENET